VHERQILIPRGQGRCWRGGTTAGKGKFSTSKKMATGKEVDILDRTVLEENMSPLGGKGYRDSDNDTKNSERTVRDTGKKCRSQKSLILFKTPGQGLGEGAQGGVQSERRNAIDGNRHFRSIKLPEKRTKSSSFPVQRQNGGWARAGGEFRNKGKNWVWVT